MIKNKLILVMMVVTVMVGGLMAWGLTKIGDTSQALVVPTEKLLDGARWVTGDDGAKVTVVEFSDVQCPACKLVEGMAEELRGMKGVRFVYRHFPLTNIHKNSMVAAMGVEAAREMGKGWEMMEKLFDSQEIWAVKSGTEVNAYFVDTAKGVGLDGDKFKQSLDEKKYVDWITADIGLANSLRLPGTPTFFVNGVQTSTSQVMAKVKSLLVQ